MNASTCIAEVNCLDSVDHNHMTNKLGDAACLKTAIFFCNKLLILCDKVFQQQGFQQQGFQQQGLGALDSKSFELPTTKASNATKRNSSLFLSKAFGSHHLQQQPTSTTTTTATMSPNVSLLLRGSTGSSGSAGSSGSSGSTGSSGSADSSGSSGSTDSSGSSDNSTKAVE